MSAHVTHLLAAYSEGQLSPRLAARVVKHTRECAPCRDALARHDHVSGDLVRTVGGYLSPHRSMQTQWWQAIQTMPVRVHRWRMSIALPLLLALFLLIMPIVGAQQLSLFSTGLDSTQPQPEVDITLNPPTSEELIEDTRVQAEGTPGGDLSTSQIESHPTLARFEVPLIATPPSN